MPTRYRSLLHFTVTPRFEVFYALRVLEERSGFADGWRSATKRALPREFRSAAERVAPRPLMWALLADTLRDSRPDPTFREILETITSLDDEVFQRAVLSGVFRNEAVVRDLIAGRQSLGDAVSAEIETNRPLLGLLGTVTGMIDAFGTLSANGGYATVTELSNGVYKSLLTTAAGLVVATPTFIAYSYLSSRVNTLMHEMERAGIEVVQMLTEREPKGDIITFQAPAAEREAR